MTKLIVVILIGPLVAVLIDRLIGYEQRQPLWVHIVHESVNIGWGVLLGWALLSFLGGL